jgi:hypothetical protein
VLARCELERYLSARDGRSWQLIREQLELKLTDVIQSDATTPAGNAPVTMPWRPDSNVPLRSRRSRPEGDRAKRALNAIYPNGVPDQGLVSNTDLHKKVNNWLKAEGVRADISYRTVLRAADRDKAEDGNNGNNGNNGNAEPAELAECIPGRS